MLNPTLEEGVLVMDMELSSLRSRAHDVRETFRGYISSGHRKFVLHILRGPVTSTDLAVLVGAVDIIKKGEGDVAVYTEDEHMSQMLSVGCWPLYRRCANRREAIEYFR